MKNKLIILLFVFIGLIEAADQERPYFGGTGRNFSNTDPRNDGSADDIVLVNDGTDHGIPEVYDRFYCLLIETEAVDDSTPSMKIRPSLFIQLCVQASKATQLDQQGFKELVDKIRSGTINYAASDYIYLTQKDGDHRLLSYIPRGRVHALVNERKVVIGYFGGALGIPEIKVGGWGYDFESNPEHHKAITNEFMKLIKQDEESELDSILFHDALEKPE